MSDNRNYYEMLGLERSATEQEIKDAYKEIARVFHPDSNFYDEIIEIELSPEQNEKFRAITAAYNVLVNPNKRKAYDQTLPPELKGWEQETHKKSQQEKLRTESQTWKRFGVFDEELEEEQSELDRKFQSGRLKQQFAKTSFSHADAVEELHKSKRRSGIRNSYEAQQDEADKSRELLLYIVSGAVAFLVGVVIVVAIVASR